MLVTVRSFVGVAVLVDVGVGVLNQPPRLLSTARKARATRRNNPIKMNRMVLGFMMYLSSIHKTSEVSETSEV